MSKDSTMKTLSIALLIIFTTHGLAFPRRKVIRPKSSSNAGMR